MRTWQVVGLMLLSVLHVSKWLGRYSRTAEGLVWLSCIQIALVSTLSLLTMMRGSHVDLLNIPPPSPGEGGLRVSAGGEDQRAALRPQCHQNSLHKISSTLRGQTTQWTGLTTNLSSEECKVMAAPHIYILLLHSGMKMEPKRPSETRESGVEKVCKTEFPTLKMFDSPTEVLNLGHVRAGYKSINWISFKIKILITS